MTFRRILGLDILPGHSPLNGNPQYAAVILVDGIIKRRIPSLSLDRIPDIVRNASIDAIAIDNIYELAPDNDRLASFFKKEFENIPALIQTTLINGEKYSIENLCKIVGICRQKPGPLETAEVSALLAYNNIGTQILLFEEETRITIARGRVPGQGGMSRERYKRNIELLILRKTREVKEKLSKKGLDFDLFVRKGGAGLEGAVFIVYASRDKLKGLVKKSRGHDIVVDIEPVVKEKIEQIPLGKKVKIRPLREKYIIVGVDPGISTGVAILDLNGNIVDLFTKRWLSRNQLSRILYTYGKPVLIATDVYPPATYVKKLSASLNAHLYSPQRVISIQEKRDIASQISEKYGIRVRDSHQRDALSAAYKCYQYYRIKFEQVEKEAEKYGIRIPIDEAKILVIKGVPVSEAVKRVIRKRLPLPYPYKYTPRAERKENREKILEQTLSKYQAALNNLLIENFELKREIESLQEENAELNERLNVWKRIKDFSGARDFEIAKLKFQIRSLQDSQKNLLNRIKELEEERRILYDIIGNIAVGKGKLVPKLSYIARHLASSSDAASLDAVVIDKESIRGNIIKRILDKIKETAYIVFESKDLLNRIWSIIEEMGPETPELYLLPPDSIELINSYYIKYDSLRKSKIAEVEPKISEDISSRVLDIIKNYREKRKRELENGY